MWLCQGRGYGRLRLSRLLAPLPPQTPPPEAATCSHMHCTPTYTARHTSLLTQPPWGLSACPRDLVLTKDPKTPGNPRPFHSPPRKVTSSTPEVRAAGPTWGRGRGWGRWRCRGGPDLGPRAQIRHVRSQGLPYPVGSRKGWAFLRELGDRGTGSGQSGAEPQQGRQQAQQQPGAQQGSACPQPAVSCTEIAQEALAAADAHGSHTNIDTFWEGQAGEQVLLRLWPNVTRFPMPALVDTVTQ